jgi:hypothetical protein
MMKRPPREQVIYVLSILFAIAPFAFGMIRAFQTGHDLRLLWMAFASFLGALIVRVITKARSQKPGVLVSSAFTFAFAALLAGSTAYLLGATAAAGVWGVAFVLALCWAASYILYSISYSRPI